MNVANLLETNAKNTPVKPALIFQGTIITFRELKESAFRFANSLLKLGIKRGDKIAIYLPNWPEYVISYLATWCAGAVAVPLDFMLTGDELVSCIGHSDAKVLIAKPKANLDLAAIKKQCPLLSTVITVSASESSGTSPLCGSRHDEQSTFVQFERLLQEGPAQAPGVSVQDSDPAIIFYTSGTTGKPKGVLVNYKQLDAPPEAIKYFVNDIKENDVALSALPFSHLGGMIYIQACIVFRATTVLMDRFIPLEFLKMTECYKINWFWLVPSMYYAFLQLKEFESFDLSSLRWIVLFGAPSAPDAIRRFHAHCPKAVLYHGWGMTETNAPTTVIPTGSTKIESVGKPFPGATIKIFDDADKEVAAGQVGEIVLRGWVVTDGYYKDAALTDETKRNGWFHTGDLGRFDSDGFLYICGRKKEMIKVAGEIVFEPEVEAVLHKHPDIAEAAVIGVADKLRGEVPKAFVVFKDGKQISAEDLRYFCRQHLAHFKIPHYFECSATLPKNRTGKIDKETLRRSAASGVSRG